MTRREKIRESLCFALLIGLAVTADTLWETIAWVIAIWAMFAWTYWEYRAKAEESRHADTVNRLLDLQSKFLELERKAK